MTAAAQDLSAAPPAAVREHLAAALEDVAERAGRPELAPVLAERIVAGPGLEDLRSTAPETWCTAVEGAGDAETAADELLHTYLPAGTPEAEIGRAPRARVAHDR